MNSGISAKAGQSQPGRQEVAGSRKDGIYNQALKTTHTMEGKKEEQTLGQKRVRVNFNVSGDSTVDKIKQKSAELIDLCESLRAEGKDGRLISIAQTEYESASSWAVKAATSESQA